MHSRRAAFYRTVQRNVLQTNTKGASPRRAATPFGPAHARSFRGCMIYIRSIGLQANRGCTCDSTAKGYIHINRVRLKKKKHWNQLQKKLSNNLRHPGHGDEQQQQQQPPHNMYVCVISTTAAGAAPAAVRQQQAAFPVQ